MYYDFQKDVKIGEESQKKFANLLWSKYHNQIKNIYFNKDKRFDLLLQKNNEEKITFEIKRDLKAHITGNIAIETYSRGKLSGINTTIADYFVIHCKYNNKEHFYVFKTKVLRESIQKNIYREIYGGDKDENGNYTTRMVLLKLENELKNLFIDYIIN